MLIECEVWVCGPGTVWKNGCGWCEQHKERRVIDTDLYEWFGGVVFFIDSPSDPYPGQCNVPHRDHHKSGLRIDRSVLNKIRSILSEGKVTVI